MKERAAPQRQIESGKRIQLDVGAPEAPSAGCILEITGCDPALPVLTGTRPTRTGLCNYVILSEPLAAGATAACVESVGDEATVLAAGTGYAAKDLIAPVKGSFYAGLNKLGSMEIIAIIGAIGGNTECRVRITGKRGDNKIVKVLGGSFVVVESIEFDEAVFSVAAGATPGLTEVS